jgi:hypothetical protein
MIIKYPCFTCKSVGLEEIAYCDHSDNYTLKCATCDAIHHVHYTGYDNMMEEIEFSETINSDLKEVFSNTKHRCTTREVTPEQLKSGGKLIQDLTSINYEAYYAFNDNFYMLQTLHEYVEVLVQK